MNKFQIVPATRELAVRLAPQLRDVDVEEIRLTSGRGPEAALLDSLIHSDSDMCWAALLDDEPVAMFGANYMPFPPQTGGIWLLASPGVYEHRRDFLQRCLQYLKVMHARYDFLFNMIHAENKVTRRWLDWLGFVQGKPTRDYGVARAEFIPYFSSRSNHV